MMAVTSGSLAAACMHAVFQGKQVLPSQANQASPIPSARVHAALRASSELRQAWHAAAAAQPKGESPQVSGDEVGAAGSAR
jgi:hypothetical protein